MSSCARELRERLKALLLRWWKKFDFQMAFNTATASAAGSGAVYLLGVNRENRMERERRENEIKQRLERRQHEEKRDSERRQHQEKRDQDRREYDKKMADEERNLALDLEVDRRLHEAKLEKAREQVEVAKYILVLNKAHKGYSQCMERMSNFRNAHGEEYAKVFISQMESTGHRDKEVVEVNACRSLCKDYWRSFEGYKNAFTMPITEYNDFKAHHKRFLDLVEPLDHLRGYDASAEGRVYKLFDHSS